ncbi:MAG TPA: GGDEF domain-containing protein, partial [Candidatus Hodarchaeales archaeon]|nr:GGDEF domain-containing protein [Candidatus Hodarchaeales archaeon]
HVLIRTARIFQSMIRKQDLVGRWGGEEFLMILPGSPYCDAESLAERVRSEIAHSEYRHSSGSFRITVSIGVTCADETSTGDQTLKKADDALYEAKSTKNSVSVMN